jgi:hypothetical protein
MSERVIDFVEEWQTGFFVVVGSAVVGIVVGLLVGSMFGPAGFLGGFVGGALLAFLVYSYARYAHGLDG